MNIQKIKECLAAFEINAPAGNPRSLQARGRIARDMRELLNKIDSKKRDATQEELHKLGAWSALAL